MLGRTVQGRDGSSRKRYLPSVEAMEPRELLSLTVNLSPEIVARSTQSGDTVDIQRSNSNTAFVQTRQVVGVGGGVQLRATANGASQASDSSLEVSGEVTATKIVSSETFVGPESLSVASTTYRGTFTLDTASIVNFTGRSTQPAGNSDGFTGVNVYVTQGGENDAFFRFDKNSVDTVGITRQLSPGTYSFYLGASTGILVGGNSAQGPSELMRMAGFTFSLRSTPVRTGTSTTLTRSPDVVTIGNPVTLTAVVTPISTGQPFPTGRVRFSDGEGFSADREVDTNGKAVLTSDALRLGTHQITATYLGDEHNGSSSSNPTELTVNPLVNLTQLRQLLPNLPLEISVNYYLPLNEALSEFKINTPRRIAAFLSQIAVESKDPRTGIPLSQFRQIFNNPPSDAFEIGRGPIQLTHKYNYVDAQNYFKFPNSIVENPELVASDLTIAFRTSAWFYSVQSTNLTKALYKVDGLNSLADSLTYSGSASLANPDFMKQASLLNNQLTRIINGPGRNALKDRYDYYIKACILFLN